MLSNKDSLDLLRMEFPQLGRSNKPDLITGLQLLASDVDKAVKKGFAKQAFKAFDLVNFLLRHGNEMVKRQLQRSFFANLRQVKVRYTQGGKLLHTGRSLQILKNYQVRYRIVSCGNDWTLKSINIAV